MLAEQKIITNEQASEILKALSSLDEKSVDQIELDEKEDLYLNIERFIINESTKELGGKVHIGRSRNDLYATAFRMAIRNKIDKVIKELIKFKKEELKLAEDNLETVMPGYTNLQHAQPITLAHYLVGHSNAITRDIARLENAYEFTNLNPLGAAALATTSFPINRKRTTDLLGFREPIVNSLDAIVSRDYLLDFISELHLVRILLIRQLHLFIPTVIAAFTYTKTTTCSADAYAFVLFLFLFYNSIHHIIHFNFWCSLTLISKPVNAFFKNSFSACNLPIILSYSATFALSLLMFPLPPNAVWGSSLYSRFHLCSIVG